MAELVKLNFFETILIPNPLVNQTFLTPKTRTLIILASKYILFDAHWCGLRWFRPKTCPRDSQAADIMPAKATTPSSKLPEIS